MGLPSRKLHREHSVDEDATIEVKQEDSVDSDAGMDDSDTNHVASIKGEQKPSPSPSESPLSTTVPRKVSRSSSTSAPSPRRPQALHGDSSNAKKEPKQANGLTSPTKLEPKEPVKSTKASRTASKLPPRVAPIFDYLPDSTAEATSTFTVIDACTYQNKYLGFSDHALDCDCSEEWDSIAKVNHACGDDSDCINRACKMECANDCSCGQSCQNQRFLRRLYADVSVIKTEKKGYGLRANTDLRPNDFIFEYIGETIPEATFRKRMISYDEEGIKHFYFMSLSKGEFIDATKRGNLGRFCNHSCNPNCYVDKWVVGDKLRMGIFAERNIKAGEELVFNYNVDRYGADPQPCYCGEVNCTGFIGGKTQTERATKLSTATIEALGIEDADSWDTAVAKRPRKKKTAEDDEDYVDSVEAKSLDADGVTKVMAALMQCKEKWIAVKLLQRIQRSEDDQIWHRVVRFHGYQILNSQLSAWRDDENIILQILDVLNRLPRLTRNKIVDAKIDQTLKPLADHTDDRVATQARALVDEWSKLEIAYRIPRKKREDSSAVKVESTPFERRESAKERRRSKSRSKSPGAPRGPALSIPSGPRSLQRSGNFSSGPRPFPRGPPPLPRGWFATQDQGRTYFYSATGQTTWTRPTQPADQPPPPPKQPREQDVLKSIIDNIVTSRDKDAKTATPETPEPVKSKKEERWKSYDEEKQKKLYENTLFPHISHVMNKYKHKIPKDDLKRFAKEIAKKLVASDFKAGRVKDPRKIDERQQKKVKDFCKQFFEKAYQKHKKHELEKGSRRPKDKQGEALNGSVGASPTISPAPLGTDADDVKLSDDEADEADDNAQPSSAQSPSDHNGTLKRKRLPEAGLDNSGDSTMHDDRELTASPAKRLNVSMEVDTPPPPPPPPAPPIETPPASTPRDGEDDGEDDLEMSFATEAQTDIHADSNFRGKSMADVLAQAQQEETVDETSNDVDMDMEVHHSVQ